MEGVLFLELFVVVGDGIWCFVWNLLVCGVVVEFVDEVGGEGDEFCDFVIVVVDLDVVGFIVDWGEVYVFFLYE